jgi:hypothetical protein
VRGWGLGVGGFGVGGHFTLIVANALTNDVLCFDRVLLPFRLCELAPDRPCPSNCSLNAIRIVPRLAPRPKLSLGDGAR